MAESNGRRFGLADAFLGWCVGFAVGLVMATALWSSYHHESICRAYLSVAHTPADSLFTMRLWDCKVPITLNHYEPTNGR